MIEQSLATGDYVQLMIRCQSRLYAFILSLLGDADQANDVMQETNIVLWQKADEFQLGTNFMAWVFRIARFQVMAYRQRKGRDRLLFDDETVAAVADDLESLEEDDRLMVLADCLDLLPENGRELIERRYTEGASVKGIAEELDETANRIAVRLHRLRVTLMKCIQRELPKGEPA